jgi:predicted dehydrogenase
MKLRVGVVGLGDSWETRHRLALLSLSDRFDVRAVCCEVAQRAEQVAREFNAVALDGYRTLAERSDVDAVLMLAPGWYGALPVLAACESGKAIYCAATLELASERIGDTIRRIDESGVAFMAELPRRHAPATLRLKELIATHLGKPKMLFCHRRHAAALFDEATSGESRVTESRVTESTRDLFELVDWCRYVVGRDPASVFGVVHESGEPPICDYQMLSLAFSEGDVSGRGPLAQISCGEYMPSGWREAAAFRPPAGLQVACQHGVAFVDLPSTLIWFDEAGRHMESLDSERPVGEQLLTQFHRAVTSLVRNSSDLEDAYRAVQIVLSAQRSAREGRRITLDF